ncbi:peptide transporter family 1-like isoform X2 [Contarinia nasturtii]|uniref:peptide transporter family 1-like isoform X2 n=1 Tax=Contarinia nasturtii TaxID=265458 RepID=UPI0012D3C0C8|nr:peptide transporter family 1-like isoform X2 [Contarinia nasturtii]
MELKKNIEDGGIQTQTKLAYPKCIFFIISNEVCERFNFYGIRTILYLYMTDKLKLDPNTATVQFHAFSMFVYFTSIFGGILSDVWLGRYRTILSLSIVYAVGSLLISIVAIPSINISATGALYVGLAFIAIGSGGIKPCVSVFAGDQFKLPEQSAELDTFFSWFYFAINLSVLISSFLTPFLRENVHCFGENDCYSLAFAVPAFLMIISIVFLIIGKHWYTMKPPSGNILFQIMKCITNAILVKIRLWGGDSREHFLDYSIEKYGQQLVDDTKMLLEIVLIFVPMPLFWSLFDQIGSRWVEQATKMNGNIGWYKILPDQMQMLNPFLDLAFIPTMDFWIYPILNKFGIRSQLQKLAIGGFFGVISFAASAMVQWQVENSE